MNDKVSTEGESDTLEALVAMPTITCGCGFTVSGFDEDANQATHADHFCDTQLADHPAWHESVFSFWGAAVAFATGWAIVEILGVLRP